jgi:hypothetical protein
VDEITENREGSCIRVFERKVDGVADAEAHP